jgi:hypothetical protein
LFGVQRRRKQGRGAQKERRTLTPTDVYANLYRLKARKVIHVRGKRGSQRYFVTETKEATS